MYVAKSNNEFLDDVDRARCLYSWSRMLNWDTASIASQLGVSSCTVNQRETGTQPMPDARWMLFVLLVREAVEKIVQNDRQGVNPDGPELAVILGPERLHRQMFNLAGNDTIRQAAEQWAAYRDIVASTQDRWAYVFHCQMVKQALRAELKNPEIRTLKDAVEKASMERNAVDNEQPFEIHQQAERKLQAAINALQEAIAKGVVD